MTERKGKIIDFIKEAQKRGRGQQVNSATPDTPSEINFYVNGNGNAIAGRDVNINKREFKRFSVNPLPEHVTPAQKQIIQEKLSELVAIGELAGKESAELYPQWWIRLKKRFHVNSYHELNQSQFEDVIKWLAQQKAMARPKLRRRNNDAWRKEHYKAIWAKQRQLGHPKEWVYLVVQERIGKVVDSLTSLGERDLVKLYRVLMAM